MTKNLNDAIESVAKADAIMFAIENTYFNFDFSPEDLEKANRAQYAFYALWDVIKNISDCLDKLEGDSRVVDAIYAVNEVSRTLTTE